MAQYVRFYSGDPIRLTAGFYMQYDKRELFELVERALGRREGKPLPISPDNPGALIPYQPATRGMAGTYAATSLPDRKVGSSEMTSPTPPRSEPRGEPGPPLESAPPPRGDR
jgi:hypothetical protein